MRASAKASRVLFPILFGLATCATALAQTSSRQLSASPLQEAAREIAAGKLDEAEKNLRAVLAATPGDYRALDLLGVVRVLQHQEAKAEELFGQVVKTRPDFAPGHAHLGLLYLRLNRPEDALLELREALRIDPGRTDAVQALVHILRDQAQKASQRGDWDRALNALIEARKYAGDNADVLYEFGYAALRSSLIDDAIDAFQQTLKLRKGDSLAVFYLGYALLDRARFDDARQQFAQYVALRPDDPSGYGALGMALAGLGRSDDARPQFEKSIALDPKQSESYYQLGLLDLDAGDYDAATRNLQRALDIKPNDAATLTALGRVEFEQKQYPDAMAHLQQAVSQDSSVQEAHYYLGLTLARMGRKEESSEQLEIATRLEEDRKARGRRLLRLREPDGASPAAK
jgi:tetratricopeptide (TPR) repeat protein